MRIPNSSTVTRRRFLGTAALCCAAALWPLGTAARALFERVADLPARIRARTKPLDMAAVRRPGPWAG